MSKQEEKPQQELLGEGVAIQPRPKSGESTCHGCGKRMDRVVLIAG
jgi:hypothetical protein